MADTDNESKVGYRRPPKASQFKPGESGNPKGRPKGSHSILSAIKAELDSSVEITVGGEPKKMTKRQAIAKAVVHKGIKGDTRALAEIIKLEEKSQSNRSPIPPVSFTLKLGDPAKPPWLLGNADSDGDPMK